MASPPINDLEFLGLPADTDLDRLKATRNALVKEFHPDRFQTPEEKAEAHEQTIRVNVAYERVRVWLETESREVAEVSDAAAAAQRRQEADEAARQERARMEREAAAQWEEPESPDSDRPAAEGASPPPTPEGRRPARSRRGQALAMAAAVLILTAWITHLAWQRDPEPKPPATAPRGPVATGTTPVVPRPTRPPPPPAVNPPLINPVTPGPKGLSAEAPGSLRWEYEAGDLVAGPLLAPNGTVHVLTRDGVLHAINGRTGLRNWTAHLRATGVLLGLELHTAPRPEVRRVFVTLADGRVIAFHAPNGSRRWEFQDNHPAYSLLTGTNGLVFVESKGGMLTALEVETGAKRWEYSAGMRTAAAVLGPSGIVYVVRTTSTPLPDGTPRIRQDLVALGAADGRLLWEFPVETMSTSPTATIDGRVFAQSNDGVLHALDGRTGTRLWATRMDTVPPGSPPAFTTNQTVFVEDAGGSRILAVHAGTGAIRWEFSRGKPSFRKATGGGGNVYIWSAPVLHVLDSATGIPVWERTLAGDLIAQGVGPGGNFYAATSPGTLTVLRGGDGSVLWETRRAGGAHFTAVRAGPNASLYAASSDGQVTAFVEGTPSPPLFRRLAGPVTPAGARPPVNAPAR